MKFHYETVLHAPGESFSIEIQSGAILDCVYHVHPEFELTFVESGFGTRFVGDLIEPFREQDLILVGGMVPHHYLTRREDSTGPDWSRTRVIKFHAGFRDGAFLTLPEFEPLKRMLDEAASAGLHFPEESARRIAPDLRRLPELSGWERFLALTALLCRLAEEPRRKLTLSAAGFSSASSPCPNFSMHWISATPSAACTRAFSVSTVSKEYTGTCCWFTMGPQSTSGVTLCTVQPVSRRFAASTASWTLLFMPPANSGSSEGCTFSTVFLQRSKKNGERMRMYPISRTRSAA